MEIEIQQVQLKPQLVMKRKTLTELPSLNMPEGYTIRSFRSGDEEHWERIIRDSFEEEMDYNIAMKKDEEYKAERVLFVCFNDRPVATASAWYVPKMNKEAGYLHMVGCEKDHLGKKLGYFVSLAALYQIKREGRTTALLQTDDFRIPAIITYLRLDFEPEIVHENQHARWKNIFEKIDVKNSWNIKR